LAEVIISHATGDRRYSDCNQCASRREAQIWKLSPDLSGARLVGRSVSWTDLGVTTGRGIAGFGSEFMNVAVEHEVRSSILALASPTLTGTELEEEVNKAFGSVLSYEEANDSYGALRILMDLAKILGDRPDADTLKEHRLNALAMAAFLHVRDGNYAQAKAVLAQIAQSGLGKVPGAEGKTSRVRFDLAQASGDLSEQYRSLTALTQAGADDPAAAARGTAYLLSIGDFAGALAAARQASAQHAFLEPSNRFELAFQRAVALVKSGSLDQALDILLATARTATDNEGDAIAKVYLLAAEIAVASNQPEIARYLSDSAIAHVSAEFWKTEGALILTLFGSTELKRGRTQDAEAAFKTAIRAGAPLGGLRLALPYDGLAQLAELRQRRDAAISATRSGLAALTVTQKAVPIETQKLSFVRSTDELATEQMVRLQRLQASVVEQFAANEAWRAQVLRSMVRNPGPATDPMAHPTELLQQIGKALHKDTVLVSYFLGGALPTAIVVDGDGARLVTLPESRGTLRSIRARIDRQFTPDTPLALKNIRADQVPSAMTADLQTLYKALIAPLNLPTGVKSIVIIPDGEELYGMAWNALLRLIPASASGAASAAPDQPRPLGFDYVIRVLPSAQLLETSTAASMRTAILIGSTLAVSGEALIRFMPSYRLRRVAKSLAELPAVAEEIASVQTILGDAGYQLPASLVVRSEADADQIPSLLGLVRDKGIVHIAGHGLFDRTDNMASALLLGGGNEHGLIRAADLVGLDLTGTELVSLSGCETGDVGVQPGQEAFGFVRGILMAGARRAIVSQWKVADQPTREWFSLLYTRFAQTRNLEDAYQAAIIDMAKRYAHPYYWAAFTLYAR